MDKHPIEGLMTTTLENIRDMVDVNTVVGEPITAADSTTIIPISRVSFGFVAGGGEYPRKARPADPAAEAQMPFAGGTGAGVTVMPLGFLVIGPDQVRMLPAACCQPIERLIELIPQAMTEVHKYLKEKTGTTTATEA